MRTQRGRWSQPGQTQAPGSGRRPRADRIKVKTRGRRRRKVTQPKENDGKGREEHLGDGVAGAVQVSTGIVPQRVILGGCHVIQGRVTGVVVVVSKLLSES